MKKLFLSILFMTLSIASFSQNFKKKYAFVILEKSGVIGEWQNAYSNV